MSMWVQFDVKAFGEREAIGKFFNLDPKDDIHYIDRFSFSFGQKNIPGLRFGKLVDQNPDLIFLVHQSTDYDSTWFLIRGKKEERSSRYLFLYQYTYGEDHHEFSKKALQQYELNFPYLMKQHNEGRPYEWEMFVSNFENAANMLEDPSYNDRVSLSNDFDPEFDKQILEE